MCQYFLKFQNAYTCYNVTPNNLTNINTPQKKRKIGKYCSKGQKWTNKPRNRVNTYCQEESWEATIYPHLCGILYIPFIKKDDLEF